MKTFIKVTTLIITALLLAVLATNTSFAGKPTGGGGGKKVNVELATPNLVDQDYDDYVTIEGSGFDDGSNVRFLVAGTTDDTQIEVSPAEYISSTKLKVRIKTNGSTAPVDYDIEVQSASGRKGKGTTLFKVESVETACTGLESKDPEIAFLTGLDTSGEIHTQDLYLSSASGCDQYLLLEEAMQFLPDSGSGVTGEFLVNVTELRLDVEGSKGIVTWRDRSLDPHPQIGLGFDVDGFGNVTPDPLGPQQLYVSENGADARGADVRINDQGEIELVMIERAADDSEWGISYLNANTREYVVLSGGSCPVQDVLGDCYHPAYAKTWWNHDGSQVFVNLGKQPSGDGLALARIQRVNAQWHAAEIFMTHYNTLAVVGISSTGHITYEREEMERNKRGKVLNREWITAVIDPASCIPTECLPSDGVVLAVDGTKFPRGWTRNGSLLFIETGPGNQRNLREYSNPFTGEVGALDLRDIDRDQRDTTF